MRVVIGSILALLLAVVAAGCGPSSSTPPSVSPPSSAPFAVPGSLGPSFPTVVPSGPHRPSPTIEVPPPIR